MIDRVRLIREWLAAAAPTAAKIGCSPSAIVAQAILESGWGAHSIGNNIFGIKASGGWTGATRRVLTREVINGESVMMYDDFRDYPTLADSFADHFAFLQNNPRYAAHGVFDPNDEKSDYEYFLALQAAGYATDPNYADRLMDVKATVDRMAGLQPAPEPDPHITVGDKGEHVRQIQAALNRLSGAMLDEDGDFGPLTYLATKHFQQKNGLGVDGVVGPKTLTALGLERKNGGSHA